jgi:hypothetical protein
MLARRCATNTGTVDRVFDRDRPRLHERSGGTPQNPLGMPQLNLCRIMAKMPLVWPIGVDINADDSVQPGEHSTRDLCQFPQGYISTIVRQNLDRVSTIFLSMEQRTIALCIPKT